MLKPGGPPNSAENFKKIDILKKTIYELLRAQKMTLSDLTGCLMSEPYSVNPDDLDLIVIALYHLRDRELLRVGFQLDPQGLTVESILLAIPPPTILDGFDF
ncbi:MAG: hypothetical protein HYT67_00770 [Candidatus Yanofskybacteria bacterium]|nr:hypothetical protein [Candidatus Yanofskybacteria bacterium]